MMASPDTIILLIVDYHAVIGGQDPCVPLPTGTGYPWSTWENGR